jgi:hypothetical protein
MLSELHPDALDADKIFSTPHPQAFRKLLKVANLRVDTQGRFRNARTIRHTLLMFRCLYEPAIRPHELAVIGGTSSKVLEDYYLRHLTASTTSLHPDTHLFDTLVGCFYISGFHALRPSLDQTDKIRILIGIQTDRATQVN